MAQLHELKIGVVLTSAALLFVGCQDRAAAPKKDAEPDAKAAKVDGAKGAAKDDDHDHGHEHPTAGPHGGELIELGDEEYHAELVHDDKADEVTLYILDAKAKNAVPIEAKELVINLKHDGKPEQHKLAAAPLESDGAGKSSRFVAKGNADLNEDLEHHDAEARLQVTINGASFTGKIEHHHEEGDHKDHDHDHDHKNEKKPAANKGTSDKEKK